MRIPPQLAWQVFKSLGRWWRKRHERRERKRLRRATESGASSAGPGTPKPSRLPGPGEPPQETR